MSDLIGDNRIALMQQALGGLARRQQTIAGNIANVDTPGFKRRDVPFEQELRSTMGAMKVGGGGSARLATSNSGHIAFASGGGLLGGGSGTPGRASTSPRNDGNDVDMDYEMTQLAETSLRYQLLTQATSTRLTTLREIISRSQ